MFQFRAELHWPGERIVFVQLQFHQVGLHSVQFLDREAGEPLGQLHAARPYPHHHALLHQFSSRMRMAMRRNFRCTVVVRTKVRPALMVEKIEVGSRCGGKAGMRAGIFRSVLWLSLYALLLPPAALCRLVPRLLVGAGALRVRPLGWRAYGFRFTVQFEEGFIAADDGTKNYLVFKVPGVRKRCSTSDGELAALGQQAQRFTSSERC